MVPSPDFSEDRPSKRRKRTDDPDNQADDGADEIEINVNLPEPPSKKDLRKLKKLKSKGVDTDALESLNVPLIDRSKKGAQEGETPAGTTANSAKRSPYAVWIGNLSFSTTREDLMEFFTRGSKDNDGNGGDGNDDSSGTGIRQKDITRINLPKSTKFKGQNKGFAYVDFLTAKSIADALALSEKLFNGRKVLIKASTDFNGRPDEDKEKAKQGKNAGGINSGSNPPCKSVFVGNLGYEVTEDEVWGHFSPAGKIKKVRFMTFEDSGKCKGFCWVDFEELKSAENVFAGRTAGQADKDSDGEEKDDDSDGSDEENGKSKKRKRDAEKPKKDKKKKKSNPYIFLGGRTLRLEYGEDATTRYKKRHGDGKTKDNKEGGKGGSGRRDAPREKKELTVEEKMAKGVESRLTGRIVEATGKKITFD